MDLRGVEPNSVNNRYTDDFVIFVKSEKAAQRVYDSVVDFIEKKLKLRINRSKSHAWDCALNRRGPWWNSGAQHMNFVLPTAYPIQLCARN